MTMVDLGGRIRDRGVPVAPVQRQVSRLDFVGDLDAAIALLAVPADTASAMLPDGLRLARRSATPENQHPLLLMLGRQRNVRLALFSSGIDYLEFILAVPFVEHDRPGRPRGPFGYLPCLLLDRRLPIVAGRVLLAYAKRRAAISATDETYRIACARTGEPLVSARFEATGGSSKGRLSGPIVEVLQLPVISKRARRLALFRRRPDARACADRADRDRACHRASIRSRPAGWLVRARCEGRACVSSSDQLATHRPVRQALASAGIRGWTIARRSGDMTA